MSRKVFPLTETSLVERRDLGRRENIWPTSHERNLSSTFPLKGKTFCRVSKFSLDTLQNGGRRNSARNWTRHEE